MERKEMIQVFIKKYDIFIFLLFYVCTYIISVLESIKANDTSIVENIKAQHFKFNLNANNAFKYDSSDEENTSKAPDINNQMVDETKEGIQEKILFGHKDTLFFDSNDVRFNGMYNKKNHGIRAFKVIL